MEYMEGGELFDKIKQRKKPFTEAQVAKIMNQICNAVLHLHSLGIAHRGMLNIKIFYFYCLYYTI